MKNELCKDFVLYDEAPCGLISCGDIVEFIIDHSVFIATEIDTYKNICLKHNVLLLSSCVERHLKITKNEDFLVVYGHKINNKSKTASAPLEMVKLYGQ
jgi:hypothetical protein